MHIKQAMHKKQQAGQALPISPTKLKGEQMRHIKLLSLVMALAIALSLTATAAEATPEVASEQAELAVEQRDYEKFEEIYEIYRDNFFEDKEVQDILLDTIKGVMEQDPEMFEVFVDALLSSGDRFSKYLDPQEVYDLENQKSFGGVGITVNETPAGIAITEVTPDSPADIAGLMVDDVLVTVNGNIVSNLSVNVVVDMARGEVGTAVEYGILRPSTGELLSFSLVREPITTVTVTYEIYDDYAVCDINDFSGMLTFIEFYRFMGALEEAGVDNVIFDVRGNPGGDLGVVLDILNLLLPTEDLTITTVLPRDEENKVEYKSTGRGTQLDKVVVLVDGYSASAAELFAVVLQEHDIAEIIGTGTFGKAIGQTYFELSDGTIAVITTIQVTSPSGRKYHDVGVAPDIYMQNSTTPRVLPAMMPLNDRNYTEIYMGSASDAVLALEQRLVYLGLMSKADALFDEATAGAIAVYQTRSGLADTGEFDLATLISLTDTINHIKTIPTENDDQFAAAVEIMEG